MNHFNILLNEKDGNSNLQALLQCETVLQHQLVPMAKVSYKNHIITIFTDSVQKSPHQFYFQPLVFLDPKSTVRESNAFLKQELVRFSIQMWTQELRFKVLERLRSLPALNNLIIEEDDVQVMPYEEVQLIFKPDSVHHESIQLTKQATPYTLLSETLNFYLLCDSAHTADLLAQELRSNPGSTLNGLQLALECRGLVLDNKSAIPKRPTFTFNLSTIYQPGGNDSQEQDMSATDGMLEGDDVLTVTHMNEMTAVPVFGVTVCLVPRAIDESFAFAKIYFETRAEYGSFLLQNGMFTVNKPGLYQFNFSALQTVEEVDYLTNIELRVDGVKKAEFLSQSIWGKEEYEPIFLTSTLTLQQGQKVGIFLTGGNLYRASLNFPTRFCGNFFSD